MISVENYNTNRGIYSPLIEHNGIICGYWLVGQDYHNKSGYYGAYPPSYLKRMKLLFPEVKKPVVHLFAGKVETGFWPVEMRVDSNSLVAPDICADAENLSMLPDGFTDLLLADPPYNNNHKKYGVPKVNKKKVLKECARLVAIGGHLVWLDTSIPMWAKIDGWALRGTIGLNQSTNHLTRTITILEKVRAGGRL